MKMRIVLSVIMLLAAASCGETENPGIGTSPSADDDPIVEPEAPLRAVAADAGPQVAAPSRAIQGAR